MIVSLPMYDRPETAAAHDRLSALFANAYENAPRVLTRDGDLWDDWESADLLLSQTCGLPYRARLHTKVALVASPNHGLPGIPAGHYASVLVARQSDERSNFAEFHDANLALNDPLSQSGWAAAQAHAAQNGIRLTPHLVTGGHINSARAVADGHADIAAIDAVTWTLITRYDRWSDALKVVAQTDPTPALPYITAAQRDPAPIGAALAHAISALDQSDRDTLCLHGLIDIPAASYLDIPIPPAPQIST